MDWRGEYRDKLTGYIGHAVRRVEHYDGAVTLVLANLGDDGEVVEEEFVSQRLERPSSSRAGFGGGG